MSVISFLPGALHINSQINPSELTWVISSRKEGMTFFEVDSDRVLGLRYPGSLDLYYYKFVTFLGIKGQGFGLDKYL